MAINSIYKQRNRIDREAVVETDFNSGMMTTQGIIDEGFVKSLVNFTFEKELRTLIPRPAFTVSEVIFMRDAESLTFLTDGVNIKASKECVENGQFYSQILLGRLDNTSDTLGTLWVNTVAKEENKINYDFDENYSADLSYSASLLSPDACKCYYYTIRDAAIHGVPVELDSYKRIEIPVGCFAYGNSYYFFGEDAQKKSSLFRTKFNENSGIYEFEKVTPDSRSVSEAVTYGYNMLLGERAYVFENKSTSAVATFEGILPYESDEGHTHTKLIMQPKKNQPIDLVCYYDIPNGKKYDIVWEWREITASDWNEIQRIKEFEAGDDLYIDGFKPAAESIMVRISAYAYEEDEVSDTVERAMTVGFDFAADTYSSEVPLEQEVYDLSTADGMCSWNGRVAVWGVTKDPTILFLSDYDNPAYFPYPNNITVFDNPIIYATEFMDGLIVFTTDKLYQLNLSEDGTSWKKTLLQSHLHMEPWDRHLIQTVRNMIYFKSGNYYYMMVPKSQSTTGELTLAPITTPITSFFDRFSKNVEDIFKNTYGFNSGLDLIMYSNFLDYEDVHNVYAFKYDESLNVVNFDVIYNTMDRTWKVWIYETPNTVHSYAYDATQSGTFVITSLAKANEEGNINYKRILQLFKWNKLTSVDYYLSNDSVVTFYPEPADPTAPTSITAPRVISELWGTLGDRLSHFVRPYTRMLAPVLHVRKSSGFNLNDLAQAIQGVYVNHEDYFEFLNYQFLDTGFREHNTHMKKRFRELQLQINNLDTTNLDFGMDYIIDGAPTKVLYEYETTQLIDELNEDSATVYVDSVPYTEVALEDIDLSNMWTIDQQLNPEVSLWKVRIAVAGKGYASRLKLYSRNLKRFELLKMAWVFRTMNMR